MPQYELIDIVNDQDEVIGTIERTPEWNKTRPDLHRVVSVIVWRGDGTLVVQRRALHKKGPLQFDTSVGGLVTSGLPIDAVAAKETQEELGFKAPLKFVGKVKDVSPEGKLCGFCYVYEATHDGPYSNWEEEAERLEYFTPQEIDYMTGRFPYLFTSGFTSVWEYYKKANEKP